VLPPIDGGEWIRQIGRSNGPFELAITWPKLTVDVATALFDSALGDHRD
jgi:hypothetical protein